MSQIVRSFRPIINMEKCIKCGLCQIYCPEGTVLLDDERVIFDYRFCKGCGICANECPSNAVSMEREV